MKHFSFKRIIICCSMLFYLFSVGIVKFDTAFNFRWIAFGLHILSIFLISGYYGFLFVKSYHFKLTANKITFIPLFFLIILILISRFSHLVDYPFVAVGDEVRDAGYDTSRVANGEIKNIFTYGNYNGTGYIPTILSLFFYPIFGNSVLTYRIPTVIISILDIIILYILVKFLSNRNTAFWSASVYATLPLHIFFSRTQLVVAFNPFWTSIIFLLLFILLKYRRTIDYIALGVILGFASQFHVSAFVLSFIIFLLVFTGALIILFKNLIQKKPFRRSLISLIFFVIFYLVGFGPLILNATPEKFFHTNRYAFSGQSNSSPVTVMQQVEKIKINYLKSIMVCCYEPTHFFYADNNPLLPPILALFFLLGIGYSIFVGQKPLYILVLFAFILPFTNSAITDGINFDYRLTPLLTLGAIFTGIGITYFFNKINYKPVKYILAIIISLYLLFQLFAFFNQQPANKDKSPWAYLSMHIIYFLKYYSPDNIRQSENICLTVSLENYKNLNLMHYEEQYKFFLPDKHITKLSDATLLDNKAVVQIKCNQIEKQTLRSYVINCSLPNLYTCPLNFTDTMEIYY